MVRRKGVRILRVNTKFPYLKIKPDMQLIGGPIVCSDMSVVMHRISTGICLRTSRLNQSHYLHCGWYNYIWAGTRERGPYGFSVYGPTNAHALSPFTATYMFFFFFFCFFLLKLPQGLYYMSTNSKGSSETTLFRRLAWAFRCRLYDVLFSHVLTH